MKFKPLAAVLMKFHGFEDVTPCRLVVNIVSAQRNSSIFRVQQEDYLTLKMAALRSFGTSVKPVDTASRSKHKNSNNNITRFPFQDKFWKYNSNQLPAAMIIVINM